MSDNHVFEILLAGLATLGIYTFLYKENIIYRVFEHLFIGIATAWGLVAVCKEFLWPRIFKTMLGLDRLYLPDGTPVGEYQSSYLWYILPMLFSLLYYAIYSKKYRHLAQLVISFQLGCAGGLAFKGFFVEVLPLIFDSFRPIVFFVEMDNDLLKASISNLFFLVTFFSAFLYFFFTFKTTESVAAEKISTLGRLLMMACFGAFFGSTMMARMALLVDRLDFLANSWVPVVMKFSGVFL
ncbi:MAG TPA: hypothetical protein PKA63_11920 [Oligoflexia bacterium]|nr:hypothetical protein [Oligoflexia bacterium]HMP49361.1 hypothetical protein [Oligoflexia bacterium]